jgi:GH15 family glucan-1,4-alpha-glucosidase
VAQSALTWVEAQATSDGSLPEQVPLALNVPEQFQPWQRKWGPVATPLLWSHAMYLIAVEDASER